MGNPIENIRDFLTGGEEFTQDRNRLKELNKELSERGHLSKSKKRERRNLDLRTDRRLFVTRGVLGITAAGLAWWDWVNRDRLGPVADGLVRFAGQVDPVPVLAGTTSTTNNESNPSLTEADQIRQRIKEFENENPNNVTPEKLSKLYGFIANLYETTFARHPLPVSLVVSSNEDLRRGGLTQRELPEELVSYFPEREIEIFLGRPDALDPSIPRISAFRALMMHGFMHLQVKPLPDFNLFVVGEEPIYGQYYRVGFHWLEVNSPHKNVAYVFEHINAQFLAEYLNDPTGMDELFQRMIRSPLYRYSLVPAVVEGASILRDMYRRLGISPEMTEELHFNSRGKDILEMIDKEVKTQLVFLTERPSSTLMYLSPSLDGQSSRELVPLRNLVVKLPPIL